MYLLKPWINRLSHAQTTRARLGVVHLAKNVNSFDARLDSRQRSQANDCYKECYVTPTAQRYA